MAIARTPKGLQVLAASHNAWQTSRDDYTSSRHTIKRLNIVSTSNPLGQQRGGTRHGQTISDRIRLSRQQVTLSLSITVHSRFFLIVRKNNKKQVINCLGVIFRFGRP